MSAEKNSKNFQKYRPKRSVKIQEILLEISDEIPCRCSEVINGEISERILGQFYALTPTVIFEEIREKFS